MQKLGGITDEQRKTLRSLEAEVAFFQARTRLDQARRDIAEAVTQLRLAADSGGRHARAAHRMLGAVEAAGRALEEALRRAVYTLDSDAADGSTPQSRRTRRSLPAPGPPPAARHRTAEPASACRRPERSAMLRRRGETDVKKGETSVMRIRTTLLSLAMLASPAPRALRLRRHAGLRAHRGHPGGLRQRRPLQRHPSGRPEGPAQPALRRHLGRDALRQLPHPTPIDATFQGGEFVGANIRLTITREGGQTQIFGSVQDRIVRFELNPTQIRSSPAPAPAPAAPRPT
jgi:hypothetical protein